MQPLAEVTLEPDERVLVAKLGQFTEVVDLSVQELMPHHICTYLYELAQEFNRFYERNRGVDDPRQVVRAGLVPAYADTLRRGLDLLGHPRTRTHVIDISTSLCYIKCYDF